MKKWSEEAYEALGGRGTPSPETLRRVTALVRRCERRGYVIGCVVGIVSSIFAAMLLSCGPNQLHDAREFVGPAPFSGTVAPMALATPWMPSL